MNTMTREQMVAMAHAMREAWEGAATEDGAERPAISCLFEDGAPYLTIWDDNRCQCKHGRILENVYNVQGQRRHAQAFLCTLPGEGDEEGIDVVNVHAPSGVPKLTDKQRFQLMRNLLQSSSRTRANRPIGEGRFLIGGDMNTAKSSLGQILNQLRGYGHLNTNVEVMVPLNGKHGDICVVGGFTTTMAQETADNHDPPTRTIWHRLAKTTTACYRAADNDATDADSNSTPYNDDVQGSRSSSSSSTDRSHSSSSTEANAARPKGGCSTEEAAVAASTAESLRISMPCYRAARRARLQPTPTPTQDNTACHRAVAPDTRRRDRLQPTHADPGRTRGTTAKQTWAGDVIRHRERVPQQRDV